jgi:hypothetical protein
MSDKKVVRLVRLATASEATPPAVPVKAKQKRERVSVSARLGKLVEEEDDMEDSFRLKPDTSFVQRVVSNVERANVRLAVGSIGYNPDEFSFDDGADFSEGTVETDASIRAAPAPVLNVETKHAKIMPELQRIRRSEGIAMIRFIAKEYGIGVSILNASSDRFVDQVRAVGQSASRAAAAGAISRAHRSARLKSSDSGGLPPPPPPTARIEAAAAPAAAPAAAVAVAPTAAAAATPVGTSTPRRVVRLSRPAETPTPTAAAAAVTAAAAVASALSTPVPPPVAAPATPISGSQRVVVLRKRTAEAAADTVTAPTDTAPTASTPKRVQTARTRGGGGLFASALSAAVRSGKAAQP